MRPLDRPRDEVEQQLALLFARRDPTLIGNDYLVIGTQDRADRKRGTTTLLTIQELLNSLHDFAEALRFEPAYGYGNDQSGAFHGCD